MCRITGFTLIELLVVVAVIAVLVALTMQCVGMIRDMALRTKFSSNMRQVSMGCLGYATDNQGRLPLYFIEIPGVNRRLHWMDLMGSYADQTPVKNASDVLGSNAGVYFAPYYLDAAAVKNSVFHDPIDRTICTTPGIRGEQNRPVCNLAIIGRLQINAAGTWFGYGPGQKRWGASGRKLVTVQNPYTVGLLGPGQTGDTSNGEFGNASSLSLGTAWGWGPHQASDFLRYRGIKSPFSYIDGHVEIQDSAWFTSEVSAGLSSRFFDEANQF
jgi:prepilin-type N-terminal cleavage/methylation domain-containing protein